jgi:hypothetical protein
VSGELVGARTVKCETEFTAETPRALLANRQAAHQDVATRDRLAAKIAHVLFLQDNTHATYFLSVSDIRAAESKQ